MKAIGLAARVGLRGLALRKGRAALMMLGVAIGIVTLTVVVSVAKGAKLKVEGGIQNFGPDALVVAAGSPQFRGPGDERVTTLVDEDVAAIRALPGVRVAMPMVVRVGQDVSARGNEHMAAVMGATPDYEEAWDWRVASGEHLSEAHEASAARVAVLGDTVAKELFGKDDPVGDAIRIGDQSFKIVGVLARRGASPMGMDMDNRVVVPLSTATRRLFNVAYFSLVRVRATSVQEGDAVAARVTALMRERHRIASAADDDFAVRSPTAIRAMASAMTKKFTTMLGLVSVIALLAGAVVLANILLAAVSERRAEIGLTRALGATRRQVVQQFLVEGVTVTLAGGAVGVVVGALAATIMGRMKMPVAVSWEPFVLAVVASIAVGLAAAAVPARRAAAIDPATALRP
jgi:ABC-type lipoprotein release transport system permease subunit